MNHSIFFYISRKAIFLFWTGLIFLLIGEITFRLPSAPQLIRYEFDEELVFRYAPNQTYTEFMGNYSIEIPPITIDKFGFRNRPIDWNRPIILALGSSEVTGPGLKYDEIWTSLLTQLLDNGTKDTPLVVNTGVGGYGPYHQSVVLRRFLEKHKKPLLVIVRVSIGDRLFMPPTPEQLKITKTLKIKKLIKETSKFLPFLFKKVIAQIYAIKSTFSVNREDKVLSREYEKVEAAEKMWDQHEAYWVEIVNLCRKYNAPILFYIADHYDTPSGSRLFEKFKEGFYGSPFVSVFKIDQKHFGLFDKWLTDRRNKYKTCYTFGYDPHANSLQHRIIADSLFQYLKSNNLDLVGNDEPMK